MIERKTPPKFSLGQVVATPAALEALEESGQQPWDFLARHVRGYWGDLCDDDKLLNEEGLTDGSRLLSAYQTAKGERLWIITDAADDFGTRCVTTILLPTDY